MGASHRVLPGARTGALAVTAAALLLTSGTAAAAASGHDRWGITGDAPSASTTDLQVGAVQRHVAGAGLTALAVAPPKVEECRIDLNGEGALDPKLLEACMVVDADDPTTVEDETGVLWVEVQMSGPTNDKNDVDVVLETTGDDVEDFYLPSPSLPVVEEGVANPILRVVGDSAQSTGQGAVWWRVAADVTGYDGYLVGLDWRALKLTRAAFAAEVSLDDQNWSALPATGFSESHVLPAAVKQAPSAPRAVSAVAGDKRATVKWVRPANPGSAAITRYTVTAVPGGKSCVTSGTSCVVTGLSNQKAYRFQVRAQSAAGYSPWSALTRPVVPKPFARVRVQAKSHASKLKVDVNPNKGSGYWTFTVQKRTATIGWANVGTYNTKGSKETRTINLPKGTYRAVVAAKYGYQKTVSGSATLVK